jgi:hypothetical protein
MKTSVRWLCGALWAVALLGVPMASEAQGSFYIQRWLGPATPRQDQIDWLAAALMSGSTTAVDWAYVPNGAPVYIGDIYSSFGSGHALYYSLSVVGTNTTLGALTLSVTSLGSTTTTTANEAGVTYSLEGVGIAPDGTLYRAGNANSPVTSFYIAGANSSVELGFIPPEDAIKNESPFWEHVSYSGNWGEVSADTLYTVPEPSVSAIGIAGLALFSIFRRRKHRV